MGRAPVDTDDACDLLAVSEALAEDRPLNDALAELMLQEAFLQRRFDETPLETTEGGEE